MEPLDVSLIEVSEKRHSDFQKMCRIVQYLSGLSFQCSVVYTGQVFMFVTNQLASCVDNTSTLYCILRTDIAIPCDYFKR